MGPVRTFRNGTVVAVIAWKLAALALLPAALCCRAVMVASESAAPACCEGGEHGAMCPMKRADRGEGADAARRADAGDDRPRLIGCSSLDDALTGLLGLTEFTPDAFETHIHLASLDRVSALRVAADTVGGAPAPPPPRV